MKSKTWKRLLACVLALVMVVGMLPISALAAWVDDVPLAAAPAGEEVQVAAPEAGTSRDSAQTLAGETYTPEVAKAEGKEVHYLAFDAAGFTNGTTATALTIQNASGVAISTAPATGTGYRIVCGNQIMSAIYTSGSEKVTFRSANNNIPASGTGYQFKLLAGANGGYKIQSQNNTAYYLTHGIKENVTLGANPAFNAYILNTTGEEFFITPVTDGSDGSYHVWYAVEPQQTPYTPDKAEADGLDVHYFAKYTNGWTIQDEAATVTVKNGDTAVTGELSADAQYQIYDGSVVLNAPYTNAGAGVTNVTAQGISTDFDFVPVENSNGAYQIKPHSSELYLTHTVVDFNLSNKAWKGIQLAGVGETFYITPANDPNDGTYYIWYTTERVTPPEPEETIEHHQPTEGMVQYYLKKEGGWVGSTTASDVKLATNNGADQCSAEDIDSGIYGIWSLTHWMHVADSTVNYCTTWGGHNDQHSFRFAYDATAKGYTIQSQSTGKYLRAERGTLSMGDAGTIFYIDKVSGTNFYHVWWESEIRPGEAISGMFDAAPDNTWVFTGGEDVAGGWAQTGGQRNFMGHFEEYVRWTYAQSGYRDSTTKERYTVNTAYAGLTLADIVGYWNKYVAKYDPRAAVYMVGAEDKDDASFSEHLTAFINSAIALREDNGFAVIIKSYDSSLSALNTAVDTAVDGLKSDTAKFNRVVVVNTALTDAQLADDGHPNAAGHLELSKQLVMAACSNGSTGGNYPGGIGIKSFQTADAPETYDTEKVPTVSATEGTMTITLAGVDAFHYELRLNNGVTISGTGADGSATVTDVPENVGYTLVTRSTDGATQYKTVTTVEAELSTLQRTLVDKVNDKTTPLTWLFMGDSITHACHWLGGYDSVAQLTEDFLGTIGRDKDVVINTAVSSATTTSTLDNIQYRLNQFPAPDVASIMLGTNDCGGIDAATTYKTNLNSIITAIRAKNPNAIIILRSPTGNWTPRAVGPYCEAMKEVAEEQNCIYIDQYTETQGMLDTYSSWIRNNTANFPNQVYYGNNLHPGAKAQLDMAKMLFKGIGLWDEDNPISNLDYVLTTAETDPTSVRGALTHETGTLTLNVGALGGGLGEITLTATNAAGQSWSVTAKAGTDPALTLPDGTYTVTASGIKTSEAKTVTFASAEVKVGQSAPPIEIETSGYPEPDASKVQNYLDFGATWVSVTAPAALELHGVSGSTFTKDTDGIDSGVYGILDSTPGDGGAARWMHVDGNVTNQCSGEPNTHVAAHSFTFTYNAEKKAYTIQSVSTGKYLTQTRSGSQFAVNDTPTWFYVSPVDPENNDGTYYIWWETEPQLGGAISEMFNAEPGNTWVFTGGVDVAGQFDQTRGRRNFAGHFEEHARWNTRNNLVGDENAVGGFSPSRQRYVINTAYKGLDLHTVVSEDGWAERVTAFAPRAVTYMVGEEDKDSASFETDLAAFIDKATALRNGNGFAVIMKSYDSALADLNAKVDGVVEEYRTTAARKYSHIVVVDAPTLTTAQMTADGHPNADGHIELGRNLAVAVGGSANNFPSNAQNRYTEAAMPTFNKEVTPTVAWTEEGNMTISGLTGEFAYQVKLASGVTVSGTGTNTATVTDLPDGEIYSLITRTANGLTQYQTVTGLVGGGEVPAKTGEQKKIADLLATHSNDDPLTWLFVGDSITHGILVSGYDSAPQLMEEYLDTIGRTKDVVVNAGVSSATTASTLNAKAYRLEPFTADVAIIMLGTNDCSTNLTGNKAISKETYKENLGKIVDAIRANNPNAIIVMRTPTGFWDDRHPQMSEYVAQLKAFAEEQGLILVDQMTATQHAINTYPWSKSGAQFYGDNLHPGVVGQLKIFQMLIREMGLWNDDNEICNLDYLWTGMTTENSATVVSDAVRTNGSKLILSPGTLDANLGRTTLTATNEAGQSWSVTAEAGETPSLTLPDGTYTVAATGVMKNTAKTVTFAAAQVEIDANAEPEKLPAPAEPKAYEYVLTSGELTPGIYAIVAGTSEDANNYPRSMHYWTDARTNLDQCSSGVPANAEKVAFSDISANHLWNVEKKANGKYTFAAVAAEGNYLTGGAAGALTRGTEATEFTVAARAGSGYDLSWENGGTTYYLNWAQTHSPRWYGAESQYQINLYRQTEAALEVAETHITGENTEPMNVDNPDSYYRIPSLITLSNGWIMAASDIRWYTTFDSPNNLDTIVSISKDGGETWEYEVVNYMPDYANTKNLQVTYGANKGGSASFIDPSAVQDSNGTVYLLVDLQSPYINGGKNGTGFDAQGRLQIGYIANPSTYTNVDAIGSYDYYVDLNNAEAGASQTVNMTALNGAQDAAVKLWPICATADDSVTGYYVDAFFNTYYDYGEDGFMPVLAVQHDGTKLIHNNLFYTQSSWRAFPTAFIMLRKATVTADGLSWGEPYLLNDQIKSAAEGFIGVCPGRGVTVTVTVDGAQKERIIFPLYDNSTGTEMASVIYSDDGGVTWTRSQRVPTGNTGKTSESQIVVLPDGNGGTFLRMYSRNVAPCISYADSTDGGATWTTSTQDSNLNGDNRTNGCMVSFINLEGVVRGPDGTVYENLVLASYPQGLHNGTRKRTNGTIRLGSFNEETQTMAWLNEETVRYNIDYLYSCLTQKRAGTPAVATEGIGLLYETEGVEANAAGQKYTDIVYDDFTVTELMGDGWEWALTEEGLSPFEPVVPTLPDGAVWAYVSFTSGTPGPNAGWGTSAEPYGITLYKESATGTDGEKVTSMTDGVYKLWSGNRWMHVDNTNNKDQTNQCTGNEEDAHKFRFASTGDGYYTIKSVASTSQDRYLNIGELGSYNQLPCTETPTKFVVEKVDGQDGAFYIKAATYPTIQFKNPVTTGINQTLTYQQVTERSDVKGDGTMYVVVAPNVNGGSRTLYNSSSDGGRTDQYSTTLTENETRVTLGGDVSRQTWAIQPAESGYKLVSCQSSTNRVYLTTTATGSQLALNATGSVFTVEAGTTAGTFYLKSGTQYLSWNGGWQMASAPFAMKLYTPVLETLDLTGREEAQLLFSGTGSDQPCEPGLGGSQQFRIPALITLSNGWLVAAADVRWSHGRDNPSNLETIVSVSKDNGQTWDWEFVNYFGDYANTADDRLSTAFIDPALIQDPATGKVWMLVDVTSADGKGTSGSTGFDSQDRLLVAHVPAYVNQKAPGDAGLYTYYMSKVGTEFTVNGETVTLYPIESSTGATDCDGLYVDAFYNIYHVNGNTVQREMVAQYGSDKIVQDNLFFRQSEWRVFPTCFLMLRSAEVNETTGKLEWSDPILTNLRGTTPGAGAAFFGAGPGRGFIADDGRILFPVYDNVGGEHASAIYSDDHGVTWQRGGRAQNTVGQKTSESQIIRLPDGSLRMYSRNRGRYVGYSDSTDGGVTWGETKLDEGLAYCGNCMVSVINVEGKLTDPDGNVYENIIMASYPEGNGNYNPGEAWSYRDTGAVRFGSVSTEEGHPVTWLGEVKQLLGTAGFVYSCLTQLQVDGKASDRFGWLYEPWNVINYVTYKELTVEEVLGEGWTLTVDDDEPVVHTYTVNDIADQTYTGAAIEPVITVLRDGEVMTGGYTVTYRDNTAVGTATVTVLVDGVAVATKTFAIVAAPEEPDGLRDAVVTVSPTSVTAGETVTVTVTGIPADVTGVTLTKDGDEVVLTKDENGVYTGSTTAPAGSGLRTLVFILSADNCDVRRMDVTVTLTESGTGGSTGGTGGGTRPVTPPEEDLNDPDVPLADRPQIFEDVKDSDWFYDAAQFVAQKGLMRGVSETEFKPEMNTTRGMIVTILYRMENEPEVEPTKFLDVSQTAWYGNAAAWGEKTGIAKGMSDGNFYAMNDVTREQLAAFLFRFAEYRGYDVTARGDLTAFSDGGSVSSWAEDAMSWAVATGLIKGKGAAGLDPTSTATRGEVATILMRFCQTVEGEAEAE